MKTAAPILILALLVGAPRALAQTSSLPIPGDVMLCTDGTVVEQGNCPAPTRLGAPVCSWATPCRAFRVFTAPEHQDSFATALDRAISICHQHAMGTNGQVYVYDEHWRDCRKIEAMIDKRYKDEQIENERQTRLKESPDMQFVTGVAQGRIK